MKKQSTIRMKKITILCLLGLCLALSARSQGVFQATLSIPLDGSNGGGGLIMGDFWFQVENDEVDFIAFVSPSTFTSSLNPILSVPGSSVGFSLGEVQTGIIGSQTDPEWNPFLPPKPLMPTGYDDDGNPYFVSPGPVIWTGNFYSGQFALPPGFLDDLLAGNGKIELNSSLGGNIFVTPTPEPTPLALAILAGGSLLLVRWRKRAIS
jgi:hypothetical protein